MSDNERLDAAINQARRVVACLRDSYKRRQHPAYRDSDRADVEAIETLIAFAQARHCTTTPEDF